MLDATGTRQLAYLVTVDAIEPIPGRDFTECAVVGGWRTLVKKDVFKPGDIGIYIEIDSKTPEKEPFDFLEKYHYKVKTQKFKTFYSQGLLMAPEDFGWRTTEIVDFDGVHRIGVWNEKDSEAYYPNDDSRFLTTKLGITYATAEDNKRKAPSADKYKKMAQRHPDLFKKSWARWMMRREWGKKVMFFFFGKKKDKKGGWPSWVVKTDEERAQCMSYLFESEDWHNARWIATEKCDGTSTTFTMRRLGKKFDFYVCSRNVCFDTPEKEDKCFYESNVYLEMAQKYNAKAVLEDILENNKDLEFVTLQGETYGEGIQKRDYSIKGHDFMAFNLIYGYKNGTVKRFNPIEMTAKLSEYCIPCVPIVNEWFKLPATCDELLVIATDKSMIDGKEREGLVFRDVNGERSFKAVSNEFLAKYHGGD